MMNQHSANSLLSTTIKRKEEDNEPGRLIVILYFNAIKQKDDDKSN